MLKAGLKRFYKDVRVADEAPDGHAVLLDGRTVKAPGGREMRVASHALADAIAAEWAIQEGELDPATLPLTQLVFTALDRVGPSREAIIDQLAKYTATDLVCYRADGPADLVARQQAAWDPLLAWVEKRFGCSLATTTGIVPVEQPAAAVAALRAAAAAMDDLTLTALTVVTQAAGSLVIGLALVHGRLGADAAFEAAEVDESYQIDRWGEDREAAVRRRAIAEEMRHAARLLDLL